MIKNLGCCSRFLAKLQNLLHPCLFLVGFSCGVFLWGFLMGFSYGGFFIVFSDTHSQHHIIRACFLCHGRCRPSPILPTTHDFIHTTSGFFGPSQPHEHLLQCRVATDASSSFKILLLGNQHHAGITEYQCFVGPLYVYWFCTLPSGIDFSMQN